MMINKIDFEELTVKAMREQGHSHMRPVIQKELLHYDILFSLDSEGLLAPLTFQGGTSLRLCHGSNRFSEDLDFVGGKAFTRDQLNPIKECIEHYIGRRYELEVHVKEPNVLKQEKEHADLKVDKWQVSVVTEPQRKDYPRQRIKIEVANIEAYSREPKALQVNYSFLPDGYGDTLVLVESLDEVLADKIVSLVNTTGYVRNRDIWDMRWLAQKGARIRLDWVKNKIRDYKVDDYSVKLDSMVERLPGIIKGATFQKELSRFIPQNVIDRTLAKPEFLEYLTTETIALLGQVARGLRDGVSGNSPFEM